ncbi:hypothetical protein [Corynebacterium sp. Marseille-P4321]|uniref:hypothetical protein n=1 Tax=Corynebacterium sp. Marseille-P4321 TaxID=2736603 RepID=UPI0020CA5B57|nr:hypothetical protein [Corynebacterium sp. Marseille-P4321]
MSKASETRSTGDTTEDTVAADAPQKRERVKVRWWHILLLIAAAVTCLLLARWQWERYQSGTGTFQNLGYALQWPFFAVFFIFAYRAGLKMENEKIDAVNSGEAFEDLYEADLARYGADETAPVTEIDEDFLPQRPEMDVDTYNEMLAPRRGSGKGPETSHEI